MQYLADREVDKDTIFQEMMALGLNLNTDTKNV
jgi:hypothetical protein